MKFPRWPLIFLATGCYVGNIPIAPGTFGSVWGIPLSYLISNINLWYGLTFIIMFSGFAVFVSGKAEKQLGAKDPGCIVIDEIAGLLVTFWGLPFNIFTILTGFVIFRCFDIVKPFPIKRVERNVPGGLGIVLDDIMAGVYANLTIRVIIWGLEIR
jgi:phosphatidylglycerophosphatase A